MQSQFSLCSHISVLYDTLLECALDTLVVSGRCLQKFPAYLALSLFAVMLTYLRSAILSATLLALALLRGYWRLSQWPKLQMPEHPHTLHADPLLTYSRSATLFARALECSWTKL